MKSCKSIWDSSGSSCEGACKKMTAVLVRAPAKKITAVLVKVLDKSASDNYSDNVALIEA